MLQTVKSVASLLLGYGLLLMANGLFSTLLGVRTTLESFSTEVIGIIMGSYFLGLLLGARYAVGAVVAVGHIRAFAAFASLISVTALVHVLVVAPLPWIAMRVVAGFCMAGMVMVTESWLNERASNRTRGQILSLYMITNYAAAGAGQFLLPLADPAEFHLFSITSILFSLALVPVLMSRAQAPAPVALQPMNLRELFRLAPLGVVGAFGAGLVSATFYGLGPVFTRDIGLPVAGTSLFMGCTILGGLLLQWPAGWLSDRIDRRWVLVGIAAATAAGAVAIVAAAEHRGPVLYAAAALYGSFSFTLYSLSAAIANDLAPLARLMQTAAGLLVSYGLGAVLGPVLGAAFMGRVGPNGVFLFNAGVAACLAGYAAYRIRVRREGARKRRFIPIPSTQYSSDELYSSARDSMDRDLARLIGGYRRR